MSGEVIVPYGAIKTFARGDGVETRLMIGKSVADDTPFTTGTTVFPPRKSAPMHTHNCAEQVTILAGEAVAEVGGARTRLGPLDTSYIPADVPHRFVNETDEPLTILWIYGGRTVTRTFTDTGETVEIHSSRDQVV